MRVHVETDTPIADADEKSTALPTRTADTREVMMEENERLNDGLDKVAEEREAWKRSHAEWKSLAIKNERLDPTPYRDALHDLVMLKAQDDIGCVPPPTKEQWAKAWAEAEELVRVEP